MSWLVGALARRCSGRREVLAEVTDLVEWPPFAPLLAGIHDAAKGEAADPPLMMFKALLLQRWYGCPNLRWKRRCLTE